MGVPAVDDELLEGVVSIVVDHWMRDGQTLDCRVHLANQSAEIRVRLGHVVDPFIKLSKCRAGMHALEQTCKDGCAPPKERDAILDSVHVSYLSPTHVRCSYCKGSGTSRHTCHTVRSLARRRPRNPLRPVPQTRRLLQGRKR